MSNKNFNWNDFEKAVSFLKIVKESLEQPKRLFLNI